MQASPTSVGTLEAQNIRAILPHLPSDRFVRPCHYPFFTDRPDGCADFFIKGQLKTYVFTVPLKSYDLNFDRKGQAFIVKVAKMYKKTCERVQKKPDNLTI